jgi:hypothetical protein
MFYALSPERATVLRWLQKQTAGFVDETVRRICTEIPSYAAVGDPVFRADVADHVLEHHRMLLALVEADAPVTREDLLFVRRHTAARVGRIPIADYLWTYRIYQGVMWDGLVKAAGGEDGTGTVLAFVGPLLGVPRAMPDDEQVLRSAAGCVRRACEARLTPLMVLRRDEIVVVAPVRGAETNEAVANLTAAYERLAKQGVRLAIGVSTVHPGLAGVASAHREARGAADCLGPDGGVLALPALSAFDYLTSFRDPTAARLISPAIRQFVDEDIARGGVLTSTLIAYMASDLNVKSLSRRIHVHTNTAHYRLNRIAEQTGRDLRKLSDVLELVIAIRLAQPLGDRPPAAWA